MPILNVKVGAAPDPELAITIAKNLLELTHGILGKLPTVTSVAVEFLPPKHWIVAGKSLAEHKKSSFYFDIKVTEGTNTKDEKARYISEAFAMFSTLLGPLHNESYIYIEEVRANAYGFGGVTQEYRYIKNKG